MTDQAAPSVKLFCAPAKPKWRWPWTKAKPRAWFTIERAGQRTDDNHRVTLTAHGGAEGEGWAMQSVYTHSDTPSENARLEGLAKTLAKITGYAVYDMRKTPWNYPRDGIAPVGTLPVWFDLGDYVKERVEYKVVNGWWHPDEDVGRNDRAPRPPQPEFNIPGYEVMMAADGRYIAIPSPTEPERVKSIPPQTFYNEDR
jgi:hypothetical protein